MSKDPSSINKLRDIVNNDETSADDLLKAVRSWYMAQNKDLSRERAEPEELSELLKRTLHHNPSDHQVIPTGWYDYDRSFKGLYRGELAVIGGRPAIGKSSLLLNLGMNISARIPVLFLSFDLTKQIISDRLLRQKCGGFVPKDDDVASVSLRNDLASMLNSHKLFISSMGESSMITVEDICRKYVEEQNVGVILIDYLQLMAQGHGRWSNREQEIAQWMRFLKRLAIDLDVAIVVASQLSRAVETRGGDKRPMLSDLRESGAIEQDADKVMFVYRMEYYGILEDLNGESSRGIVELTMAKNSTGETDTIKMRQSGGFANIQGHIHVHTDFSSAHNKFIDASRWDVDPEDSDDGEPF